MSRGIFIQLNYGPYEACHGILRHNKQRLYGLIEHLQKEKYMVVLNPVPDLNLLAVEILEREIFRCDIRNLLFNLPSYEDPVCLRIIEIIKYHESLFCTRRNSQKYVNIKEGMRWLNQNRPQDRISDEPKESVGFDIITLVPANSLNSMSCSDDDNIAVAELINPEEEFDRRAKIIELSNEIVDQVFRDLEEALIKLKPKTSETSSFSDANRFDEPTMCRCVPNSESEYSLAY